MNYVTTNIRLLEEDYLRLKAEAASQRKSLSAVIREKVGTKKKMPSKEYVKMLLTLDTSWFDYKDYKKMRAQTERKLKKLWNE